MEPAVPEAVDVTFPTASPPFVVTVPTASFGVPTTSFAVDVTVPTGSSTADVAVATTFDPSGSSPACADTGPANRTPKPTRTIRRLRHIRRTPPQTSPKPHGLPAACVDYHAGKTSKREKDGGSPAVWWRRPAAPQAVFASRRSPVRSRYAPLSSRRAASTVSRAQPAGLIFSRARSSERDGIGRKPEPGGSRVAFGNPDGRNHSLGTRDRGFPATPSPDDRGFLHRLHRQLDIRLCGSAPRGGDAPADRGGVQ